MSTSKKEPDKTPDKTRDELIEEGQGLVRSLAVKVRRSIPVPTSLDDLIAYGQVGLAEAARDFDPDRGIQFTTFAYYRVRGAIYDGVSQMSWVSRARYNRLRYQKLAKDAIDESSDTTTAGADLQENASWLQQVSERLAMVYLSTLGDSEGTPGEAMVEDKSAQPAAAVATKELGEKLHELVERLRPEEQRLVRAIYFEGATLTEAANRLGISKAWGSRLHARCLEQLARWLRQIGVHE